VGENASINTGTFTTLFYNQMVHKDYTTHPWKIHMQVSLYTGTAAQVVARSL